MRSQSSNANQILIFAGIIIIAGFFFFGYDSGSRRQAAEDTVLAQSLKTRGEALFKKLKQCEAIVTATKQQDEAKSQQTLELEQEYTRLKKDNEDMYAKTVLREKSAAECHEQAEMQKSLWTEEDLAHTNRIHSLQSEILWLSTAAQQLTQTKGMRYQLLYHNIVRLKGENRKLRSQLGMKVDQDDIASEYYSEITEKWRPQFPLWLKTEQLLPTEVLMENATLTQVQTQKFVYNPEVHTEIFVPLTSLARPEWKGRVGSPKPVRGTYLKQAYVPKVRFVNLFQSMFPAALCAYEHEILNFTFPLKFFRLEKLNGIQGDNVLKLNDFVDTPLLTFCKDCIPMSTLRDFRLLCGTQSKVYGTYSYWAMRSRLQFKGKYYVRSEQLMAQLNLTNAVYLSVLWKKSTVDLCKFAVSLRERKIFSWLKSNYPTWGSSFPTTLLDVTQSCQQNVEGLIQAINKRVQANPSIQKVYLSHEGISKASWFLVTSRVSVPVVKLDSLNSIQGDVVDLILSSQAAEVIGNRYSAHTELVMEMFLLRNAFQPNGLFFF